jgi:hypothetical protein
MKTRANSVVLLVFLLTTFSTAATRQFVNALSYPTSGATQAVVTADFNGDGNVDVAVGTSTPFQGIGIYLGNGDGTFRPGGSLASGVDIYDLVTGDWNGDGIPDLAGASSDAATSRLRIFPGLGNGKFSTGAIYTISSLTKLATGDLNGDGVLDLASADGDGTVTVLLGKGDGTFTINGSYSTGATTSSYLALGDFNHDGKLDAAVAAANGTKDVIAVLLGNGDGSLQAEASYAVASGTTSVAIADFNRDGILDLCTGGSGDMQVLFGKGDGTFFSPQLYVVVGASCDVAVADLNGDGAPDILQVFRFIGMVVWLNKGDGTFGSPSFFGTSGVPNQAAVADFNKDGRPDAVTANAEGQNFTVLIGDGTGKFIDRVLQNVAPTTEQIGNLVVGNVDKDVFLDVAATDPETNQVHLFLGK